MRIALILLAFVLPACAASPRDDAAPLASAPAMQPTAYAIKGQERPNWSPGWQAVIDGDTLLLDSPTSAGWFRIHLPAPRTENGRRIFAPERLTLVIEDGACALSDYRDRYPDRVTLEWDSGRFEGCGGPRPSATRIAGTWWELLRIGAEPAPPGRAPAVILHLGSNGSLGGTLSCNDGGIRTRWTGDGGFRPGPAGFESTAVGCNDPAGEAYGRRFWGGLETARGWRRDGDRLFITFGDGSEAELRYLI